MSAAGFATPFTADRWLYTAEVMVAFLREVQKAKRVEATRLPKAVYDDACEFFQLVQKGGRKKGSNAVAPAINVNAYGIAVEAIPSPLAGLEPQQPEARLREFASFTKSLTFSRKLDKEEREMAVSLERFFLRLQHEGEALIYMRPAS